MATKIPMHRAATGEVKSAYRGIAWWMFIFGPLVPLVRGHLLAALVFALLASTVVGWLIAPLLYNNWHMNWLMGRGYTSTLAGNQHLKGVANV